MKGVRIVEAVEKLSEILHSRGRRFGKSLLVMHVLVFGWVLKKSETVLNES